MYSPVNVDVGAEELLQRGRRQQRAWTWVWAWGGAGVDEARETMRGRRDALQMRRGRELEHVGCLVACVCMTSAFVYILAVLATS